MWLAFVRSGPGVKAQVHVMPISGGESWRVTEQPFGAAEPVWSPDSSRLAFVAQVEEARGNEEDAKRGPRRVTTLRYRWDGVGFTGERFAHVFVVDPFGDEPPLQVTEGDFDHGGVAWSPAGDLLAFSAARHPGRGEDFFSDVWVCAPDGTGLRKVTRTALTATQPSFGPDGGLVFVGADPGDEGRRLIAQVGVWSVPVDGSVPARRLTDAELHNMPSIGNERLAVPAKDGVLCAVENRGAVELLRVPYDGGEPVVVVGGPREVRGLGHAGGTTVAVVCDVSSPAELVAVRDGVEVRLTGFGAGLEVLPIEEVNATAPDGYPVHGWIVRPEGAGPHPVLLMIHGGPFAQYGWRVFDEAQVYASAGYAVVMGNPRGSSGYGRAHGAYIVGDVGRRSAVDLLALFDAALATGGLDASRAGVLGGSHGGFMTTWLAAHHGERFRAAVSERALNAIDSFHGSSDIGWAFPFDLYGEPSTWAHQSPLTHAGRITIPMLIIHSEHDWRAPVEQAQRLFVALKLRGVVTEMLLFPDEGHDMSRSGRPSRRIARFDAILDWWQRHL
ncbi:dipeptidyl aminopeptidase/acylaminoacyl peptidase [Nonomuraea endophytica]|uniref:Dipeptidyl aminopeptidase/acylaminoacyl peptidase n=1 Tax=Nonomuraea endophytica TaxID=714136 RepID=A0A7W8EGD6_9ACTN|nr:dipeptidyl aminopeptidase/acylaminoacyl peptidase [Nonomuraea endophytica]